MGISISESIKDHILSDMDEASKKSRLTSEEVEINAISKPVPSATVHGVMIDDTLSY